MNTILDMDASTLALKIGDKEISPLEATEAYIQQIQRVNPYINAVVETRFASALTEAKEMSQRPDDRRHGRLYGVPISLKESFFVQGMKTTGGLPSRTAITDGKDAVIVRRLKREGAIILGKTNTPALCFCQETDNTVYGRTLNPWNRSRTAGGSSGGEGALIAVGGAAVGIAADIGGSIRFPAHFNGVIGFKSGAGQIPYAGIFPPIPHPMQQQMLGIGALAKSVADCKRIHGILSDCQIVPQNLSTYQLVIPSNLAPLPLQASARNLLDQVRTLFAKSLPVSPDSPPYLAESALYWQKFMSADGMRYLIREIMGSNWRRVIAEWLKAKSGLKHQWHPYLTWSLIGARLFKPTAHEWKKLLQKWNLAKREVQAFLASRVLILPVYHSAAPTHGGLYSEIFSIRRTFLKYIPYISYANTFGLPALTVPVGTDENGLPIAVQLITATGQEDALFQLGTCLERNFRGYVRCTQYDADNLSSSSRLGAASLIPIDTPHA